VRHRVGSIEEFPAGSARIVRVAGRSLGVFNIDGTFRAILNLCPHRFAPICEGPTGGTMLPSDPGELVYGLERRVIRCPWHGWEFDLMTGESLFGVDKRHLKMFPVTVEDDSVLVEVGRGGGAEDARDVP
jgi:nitrite reductase/ring-hydroxylating ferredoxin subunit